MTLEWDAADYEVVSVPHVGWSMGLLGHALERRPLRGDEAAVDAGCGTGKITELLLRHLPHGTVLAVDASMAMVEAARERFRDSFEGWEGPWNFAGAEKTGERLQAAGFEEVETWLQDEVARFGSRDELTRFLKTVVLGRHLKRLPESEHQPFADAVAEQAAAMEGALAMDYVRLNILATRERKP